MAASETLLEINDYNFRFPSYPGLDNKALFSSLNFKLRRGEFCIVLGAPESGKTTLSRCLTGVYPGLTQAEVSGTITLDGENLRSRSACDWIESIGIVFQDPEEQILSTRCDDEASMTLESLGRDPAEIRKQLEISFEHFSINGKEERDPLSLSGGEKKRLLLSALEMQNPDLWILDETVDELDREGQVYLLEYLLEKAEAENKGIILFASKYRELFSGSRASLVLLKDGKIITEDSRPESFMTLLVEEGLMSGQSEAIPDLAAPEKDPLIELKNIRFEYPGNMDFHLEVDEFTLYRGEALFLSGPNGCGKSTMAHILCGLIEPDAGKVILNGKTAGKDSLNRSCAYLFQNPDYQLFLPSVEEELALGLKYSAFKRIEKKALVDEAIALFNLPSGEAAPALLSFGARKRLQGAIYYLLEKNLYILDEADSGLSFSDYICILRELKKKGAALIVISHDHKLQQLETHRTVRMERGRILPEGSAE
ncbi:MULTISPECIES: ATP-binding cassette domain-containing protein [unclassified Oceanispirochaeta]|uniref:ATP-binding cassette domain-containing protein n=1 Tax=unclassified Oceanispirochaeta TaxID=2635722 RepID=UPI000E099E97|nr:MULTISPECIES: ABC transporter ATP-binding protein [unclassified Oceanispirochaeta]MBF9016921.1 ATP-binding cassette domain-containing protein [Oceanispirochaeta sp. M2]NPD73284.1 ATP-binding cassette domain-containing protein [Oceanispirochaeta sp. M1]RDG30947.1 ATP-binding cassette domain-containing protein [Oceanispirochaeta sp. M1]